MKNFKKKGLKESRGITLIALVVTIIVLLILAGISISIVIGNSGILQKAKYAASENEKGKEKEIIALAYESALASKASNGNSLTVTAEDMNAELTGKGAIAKGNNPIKVTFTDSKRQYTINSNGTIDYAGIKNNDDTIMVSDLEIGDYIKYGDKLTVKTYETSLENTGFYKNQTFETDNQVLWRVMNKKDNGEVEIVAVSNTLDNGETFAEETYEEIPFEHFGLYINNFLNAENLLNELCNQLYSSDTGTGRSINVNDINKLNNFNPETDTWSDLDHQAFSSVCHPYGEVRYYNEGPVWNEETNEISIASNTNQLSVRNTHYSYYLTPSMLLYDTLGSSVQNDDTTTYYWLASRCWNANNSGNDWTYNYNMRIRFIGMGQNQTNTASVRDWTGYSFNLGGVEFYGPGMCGVRPVVTLNSEVTIQNDNINDGKTAEKAYLIE